MQMNELVYFLGCFYISVGSTLLPTSESSYIQAGESLSGEELA